MGHASSGFDFGGGSEQVTTHVQQRSGPRGGQRQGGGHHFGRALVIPSLPVSTHHHPKNDVIFFRVPLTLFPFNLSLSLTHTHAHAHAHRALYFRGGSTHYIHFVGLTNTTAAKTNTFIYIFCRSVVHRLSHYDTGTDRGAVTFMGRAARERGHDVPLVAVLAARATASFDASSSSSSSTRLPTAQPDHTHYVLLDTANELSAVTYRFELARAIIARNVGIGQSDATMSAAGRHRRGATYSEVDTSGRDVDFAAAANGAGVGLKVAETSGGRTYGSRDEIAGESLPAVAVLVSG